MCSRHFMALEIFLIIFTINFIVLQMACLIQRNVSSKIGTDPDSDTPSKATLLLYPFHLTKKKTFIGFCIRLYVSQSSELYRIL